MNSKDRECSVTAEAQHESKVRSRKQRVGEPETVMLQGRGHYRGSPRLLRAVVQWTRHFKQAGGLTLKFSHTSWVRAASTQSKECLATFMWAPKEALELYHFLGSEGKPAK